MPIVSIFHLLSSLVCATLDTKGTDTLARVRDYSQMLLGDKFTERVQMWTNVLSSTCALQIQRATIQLDHILVLVTLGFEVLGWSALVCSYGFGQAIG